MLFFYFLYIPFFSILSTTHSLTRSDLIHIDPFSKNSDSLSSQVPSTSNTPPYVWSIHIDHSVGTDTLFSDTLEALFFSTVLQALSETVDLPLCQSISIHKSIKLSYFVYSCYSSSFTLFLAFIHYLSKPSSYKEAIFYPFLQQAMDEEFSALYKIDTWDLVLLPLGKSVIGCCWVYKIKTNSDGSIERYKTRLVMKWYSQQYGMDYEETFAPIIKMTTVHTLIAITSVRQWYISQLDVKNAFLNGDLQE